VTPLEYLLSLEQFGIKLGLDHVRIVCTALGDPHLAYPTLLIGGTNGKGSVAAMVDRALRAAGLRTGRYTSPHLTSVRERFAIDGRPVAAAELERAAGAVAGAIRDRLADGRLDAPPTFFEATTAAAFDIFREARVDLAVLEVGLGGRLDATNIAEPRSVAITSVDYDHEQQLGGSLASIAFEKAGIIKPDRPVVVGPLVEEARTVIADVAVERRATLVNATEGVVVEANESGGDIDVRFRTPERTYPRVRLGLRGRHQVTNALVAVRLLETLEAQGMGIGAEAIVAGLRDPAWPGRLEWIEAPGGRLLLDAAHNPAGALSLARYLSTVPPRMPLVFGAAKDKNVGGMLDALQGAFTRLIATQASTARAMRAEEVAARARAAAPAAVIRVQPDPLEAVAEALADAGRACVAGSIYLVGDVRGRLVR
jgi:dihydrofolate synthase/folylpolyglutamate synthase